MIPYFRYGIDISRHHLKGIYVCSIGRNKRQSSRPPVGITCTLRETRDGDLTAGEPQEPGGPEYSPIALCYQGVHTILRPWNPYSCVIAAGVQNQFLHFPIRPRSRIFVLGCSLQTLSHLADILGPTGQLIGVMAADDPSPPSRAELGRFLRRHPQVWVVTEDIPQASLERYELLLSLPEACKHAFLMALHPRLGADSAAHALAGAKGSQKVLRRIFDFLEFPDAAKARCLVVCYCTPETRVAVIRDIVSSHVDILQRWRVPGKGTKDRVEGSSEHSGSVREDARGCADGVQP
ncbi:unnamed protein product [Prorocentrum cordatum]|uniref:Uncharacterized protein n=1 Tax=Prorocentrum cordatum TaxID=2364126 RepID=A0ABN9WYI1_9DINO|nr:unnamed protein product [Polarella glacialis]